jgi:nitrogen regulatory protein PII
MTVKNEVAKGQKPIIRQKPAAVKEEPVHHKLLVVITNRGFAGEVMAQSRLTGANGGTILTGRGASREHTETFLGVNVTEEKEIVLIVLDERIAKETIDGISEKLGISTAAGSMCFLLPVNMLTRFHG